MLRLVGHRGWAMAWLEAVRWFEFGGDRFPPWGLLPSCGVLATHAHLRRSLPEAWAVATAVPYTGECP